MNMQIPIRSRLRDSGGFTLIELMVVLVIASVLVAIALPSYISSARKSRRTEAKTALLDLAGREERYFDTSSPPVYTIVPSQLGYGAAAFPVTVGSGYYLVTLALTNIAGVPGYTITATPVAGNDQANDKQCQTFTLTNTGVQTSTPNTTVCWQ
jgi:type IV pilus assembly protein PilE